MKLVDIKKHLFLFFFGVIGLTSCVRDSSTGVDCLSYVRFVYDYNMAFEDLFHNQAYKIDLFLFDENDIFVGTLSDQCAKGTFARDYRMRLPDGLPYPLQMIAWVGVHEKTCQVTELVPGVSKKEEMFLHINEAEEYRWNQPMESLWHGAAVKEEENTQYAEDITSIYLVKNTNNVRMILQTLDEDVFINADEFSFTLESTNGMYDHTNYSPDNATCWFYDPFYKENDHEVGAIAELNTMRLLEDRVNRLIITHEVYQDTIININLNSYIKALKLQANVDMPLQEYMDREDQYRIIVFLKTVDTPGPPGGGKRFVAADLTINEWKVNDQIEELIFPLH